MRNKENSGFVLGISCIYGTEGMGHDPSAVLLKDGRIIAMAAEERFIRVKKAPGRFPVQAIKYCLEEGGISIEEVESIGWYSDPDRAVEIWKQGSRSSLRKVAHVFDNLISHTDLPINTSEVFSRKRKALEYLEKNFFMHFRLRNPPIRFVGHHLSHMASAYYTSGFDEALVVAWDSGGDLLSTMIGVGRGEEIKVIREIPFSQMSMGAFYKIFQRFVNLSDEGSLMGLASYGRPRGQLDFSVDVDALRIHWGKINRPVYYFGEELLKRLGPQRLLNEPLGEEHARLAADVQDILERLAMRILEQYRKETGMKKLCMAGGVALNATMNGKIARSGLFDQVYVHPNAGDGGCALGAAFIAERDLGRRIPNERFPHVYWGRGFSNDECRKVLELTGAKYRFIPDDQLPDVVAGLIADGKIIAWFRGRSEWGPRALGSRSILADPRDGEMKDKVNDIIKYRDEWRPFAPSMLAEAADEYLEGSFYSPFMLYTFKVRPEKKDVIPSVVHEDGTTRPQMVKREVNPVYYDTIRAFGQRTGVPVIMNTSFNVKGEPIVDSPVDALKCFFGTGLDVLVMNNFLLEK